MCPSGDLHAALTKRVLGSEHRDVQKLLDRTARTHGPSHRKDREHSLSDLSRQLALQGRLTPDRLAAGALHIAQDRAWSAMWSGVRLPSKIKQPLKALTEAALVDMLEGDSRRRRGR